MRFLLTCHPGMGHLQPMVPLGRALMDAGHDVAVATASSFREPVEREGFEHIRAGLEWDESRLEQTVPDIRHVSRIAQPSWILDNIFLDRSPRLMVPDLIAAAETWRPDLLLVNHYELGGVLAAERLGLPYVTCNISFRWSRSLIKRACGRALRTLRRDLGFPPDPDCSAYGRYLDVCLMPESWTFGRGMTDPFWGPVIAARSGAQMGTALKARVVRRAIALEERRANASDDKALYVRPGGTPSNGPPPAVLDGLPDQPTVYVSLGTVFNMHYPQVFDVILEGLRDQALNVVMTLGTDGDPARFGPQPDNVRIERFVRQADLLPHVDLCVNHGGNGSVMEPLALGIPQVILPLSADQPIIAMLGLAHGVAAVPPANTFDLAIGAVPLPILDPDRITSAMIRDLVLDTFADDGRRTAVNQMKATMAALPGPDDVVEPLVSLARRALSV